MELKTAMILAAGFGTRLLPKTFEMPKALVEVKGKPMISWVIEKLRSSGFENIAVNTHHFAGQLEDFFANNNFGINIELSYEPEILGAGGGIKNAKRYLEASENFLVHNVDVSSDIDFAEMYNYHIENNPLATLAVKKRDTARPLIVDDRFKIIGRNINDEDFLFTQSEGEKTLTAFCGVHIISSQIFEMFPEDVEFDIVKCYMDLIKKGNNIVGYDIGNTYWEDLGK